MATEVSVGFELFDVQPILACPDFPIDMAQVVTWRILSMLSEFDGLSKVGAVVQSGKKTFDDVPGSQIQSR